MIIDTIDKLSDYVELNPLFADVVAFLKANDLVWTAWNSHWKGKISQYIA